MTKTIVDFKKVTVADIPALNQDNTLFISDFRATGEDLTYDIEEMYAYEDLSNYLVGSGDNSYAASLHSNKKGVLVPSGRRPSESVISRLDTRKLLGIKNVWTAVPHPDIDTFATNNSMNLNYTYKSFLKLNNKISQKKALKGFTPAYQPIDSPKDIENIVNGRIGFVKKALGSGGFNIFNLTNEGDRKKAISAVRQARPNEWYIEDEVKGTPMSFQVYKQGENHVVFGLTEQYLDGMSYTGCRILDIHSDITPKLRVVVRKLINQISQFLGDYEGFYGIDFLQTDTNIAVLELNVRVTSATVPVLLVNSFTSNTGRVEFFEHPPQRISSETVFLTWLPSGKPAHTVNLNVNNTSNIAGSSYFIQLSACSNIPAAVDDANYN